MAGSRRGRSARERELTAAFGKRLREARLSMRPKMAQKRLAEALGVSFQMIQKYEKGECHMSPAQVIMAAEALRLPVGFLLAGFED